MPAVDDAPPRVLQLLAEPRRWRMLRALADSDRRVGDLCELLDLQQNLVSYHLRELRAGGLVSSRRSSVDGRDTWYRIEHRHVSASLAEVGRALDPSHRLAPVAYGAMAVRGRRSKVLFLCTGNSARSQMAEALLVHRSDGRIAARSAGSHPKPLHPIAVDVMRERGIDISSHTPKRVDRFTRDRFDRVITLCDKVREVCPRLPGAASSAHWSMADPSLEGPDAFVRAAEELEARIDLLIAQLGTDTREDRHDR